MGSILNDIERDLGNIQADVGVILLSLQDLKSQQSDPIDRSVIFSLQIFCLFRSHWLMIIGQSIYQSLSTLIKCDLMETNYPNDAVNQNVNIL